MAYASLYQVITGNLDPATAVSSQRKALARFFRSTLKRNGGAGKLPGPPSGVTRARAAQLTCS